MSHQALWSEQWIHTGLMIPTEAQVVYSYLR
jgi:hypothetical protein